MNKRIQTIIDSEMTIIVVKMQLEMVNLGPARGPKRADTGRAWPKNPGPRAFTGRNGPHNFYLRFFCSLCPGGWVVTREL